MARDYDPQVGRYVESDPIGLKGGVNTYSYAESSPVLLIDWTGLRALTECETADLLNQARHQSWLDQYWNHSGLGKFDFSHNAHRGDTFTVNGVTYNASQFGNFIAGYSGAYLRGFLGYTIVRGFGVAYNVGEAAVAHHATDWDASSVPFIQDGAALGQYQRDAGVPVSPTCRPCSR